MSAKKSPLAQVKDQFGSKEKLVEALLKLPESVLTRTEEEKDDFQKRLLGAANAKLLRLYTLGQSVEKRWGSKEALVDALLKLQNRAKDGDYRTKLIGLSIGRLYDRFSSLEKAQRRASAA